MATLMSMSMLDWRRQVATMYAQARSRAEADAEPALATFRADKDRLFSEHPDSPVPPEARLAFEGLDYWP